MKPYTDQLTAKTFTSAADLHSELCDRLETTIDNLHEQLNQLARAADWHAWDLINSKISAYSEVLMLVKNHVSTVLPG